MKIIIILSLFFFSYPCNSQNINFPEISKKVSREHRKTIYRKTILNTKISESRDEFHKIRLLLYEQYNLDFLNKSDTLFFLESFLLETGQRVGRIWNKESGVDYEYNNKKLYVETFGRLPTNDSGWYSFYMTGLVEKWDLQEIRIEEKQNSHFMPNDQITATRVIINNGNVSVDAISFKDFFKLGRDGLIYEKPE